MRKALVVGIDYYEHTMPLFGCVNDAREVADTLKRHANRDGTANFDVKTLLASNASEAVSRRMLRDHIKELFAGECDIALFYFAGHGFADETGGFLLASDSDAGDDGLSLGRMITWANNSSADNRIILLDSCHSGVAGARPGESETAEIKEGTTILTASTEEQYAKEVNGSGVFTTLMIDALNGAAANLVGDVTPGSIYAHIDQSLGMWEQRPVFKTNVHRFASLRKVRSPVSLPELRRIREFFPRPGSEFQLDPTFEPERGPGMEDIPEPVPENTERFAILQKFNRINLVVPVGAPHMWHAAMESKSCRLTRLGEHYRRLVEKDRI